MKIDEKTRYLIFLVISTSIIAYTFFVIFTTYTKNETVCTNKTNSTENKKKEHKYIVKEDKGKIKIFEEGKEKPISTISKEIEELPEYDQNMLKNGICAYSDKELYEILEDYED